MEFSCLILANIIFFTVLASDIGGLSLAVPLDRSNVLALVGNGLANSFEAPNNGATIPLFHFRLPDALGLNGSTHSLFFWAQIKW